VGVGSDKIMVGVGINTCGVGVAEVAFVLFACAMFGLLFDRVGFNLLFEVFKIMVGVGNVLYMVTPRTFSPLDEADVVIYGVLAFLDVVATRFTEKFWISDFNEKKYPIDPAKTKIRIVMKAKIIFFI